MDAETSIKIQFNPSELLQTYLQRDYKLLSLKIIATLNHFDRVNYLELTGEIRYFINAFVKSFLYIFTQPDYVLSDDDGIGFIQLNLIISNLVAISDFRTTDPYLELLKMQPKNYVKILTLYSARNTVKFDRLALFDANPQLANRWYSHYLEIFRSGLVNSVVYQNLREHISYTDDRLTDFYRIEVLYFGATYIDGDLDRILKQKINRAIQNSQLIKSIKIENHPHPRKIAIASAFWFPQHSIYRILSACIAQLKDNYELTLIHLGDRHTEIDTQYFHEVRYLQIEGHTFDPSAIACNEFAAIYYPDIGMSLESILLANLRIAPIQICGLGHPVSTFGSEIDYFISGEAAEIADRPEVHYSERLVLLPGWGAINNRPNYQPRQAIERNSDRPDKFIINCPWYAQKVNYPLLKSLQEIWQTATKPILFRLFSGGGLTTKNDFIPFVKDAEQILGSDCVYVYPYKTYNEYMDIMAVGDLCLDSYHFSGFNVTIDSLYLKKITVVFEGQRWYSRAGSKLMQQIGLGELVVTNPIAYTHLTIKLVNEDEFRMDIQSRLDRIDLDRLIFESERDTYFRQAIDLLIGDREQLKNENSSHPIRIPTSEQLY